MAKKKKAKKKVEAKEPKKKTTIPKYDPKLDRPQAKLERSYQQSRDALNRKVRIFYDLQRIRIQIQGRLTPKAKGAEIQLHETDLNQLRKEYWDQVALEKAALKAVEEHLLTMPFYTEVLLPLNKEGHYKGMGVTLSAVILSEFDIYHEDTPSKMWAFAGLAPVACYRCKHCHKVVEPDGEAFKHIGGQERRGKKKAPTNGKKPKPKKCRGPAVLGPEDVYKSGKAMRPVRGEKLKYNAWLRSKMCGVLASCLLKAKSPFRKHYDDYKHRKETAGWGVSDAHRHQAAMRYMVKMFLLDIWQRWREHEGLEVRPPYSEEYQGKKHVGGKLANNERAGLEEEVDAELQAEFDQQGL
jgi:hypothetical protein